MGNEERRLLGLILTLLLLVSGQGCGSPAMSGELEPVDDPISDGPDPGDGPEVLPEPDTALAPPTDLEPEVLMLGSLSSLGTHVWGTAKDNIFLAAGWGLLAHYDGVRWRPFEYQGPNEFYEMSCIFGFSYEDVYVGTSRGTLHYDGERWNVVDALSDELVLDMWGSGPDDVYAAALTGLLHFDGFTWRRLETDLPEDVRWMRVTGSSEKHVVLIGRDTGSTSRSRMGYFDGMRWREAVIPQEAILNDVWSAGPKDTYAVGRDGVILHFDGQSLTPMKSGTDEDLTRVHGTPGGEAFAAGRGVFLQFDGDVWSSQPTVPNRGADWVSSVFAFDAENVFLGGRGLHRFDGASWEAELPYSDRVDDIWASNSESVLFAGRESHRYDGLSVELEDFSSLGAPALRTAWGIGDQIFAAGDDGLFLYDGEHWGNLVNQSDVDASDLLDMFGTSEDDVFAVGLDGSILHFDGAVWQGMDSGTEDDLVGVWASGPDDVYAVGDEETVLHYDGSTWSELFGSGFVDHLGLTGFDPEHIVALRDDGDVTFSDGVSWRPEPAGDLQALHGTAPDILYGIGRNGLRHYDGERWSSINEFDMGIGEFSIFAVAPREVYVAGPRGVFRYAIR